MSKSEITIIPANERAAYVPGDDISSAKTAEDALELAGLNWGLELEDAGSITLMNDNGVFNTSFPGSRFLMRNDNWDTLAVVRSRYKKIDNREVFVGLGKHIIAEGGIPVKGGEFDGGQQTFMDFELPNSTVSLLNGKDLTKFFMSIRANHAGNGNVWGKIIGRRLKCTNGQTVAIKGIPHSFKIAHNGSAKVRMLEAENILKGAGKYVREFTSAVERMIAIKMDLAGFTTYIDTIFPKPADDATPNAQTIWENRRGELLHLFKFADTNNLIGGTAYTAFNAITEYEDWAGGIRQVGGRNEIEARSRSLFMNTDDDIKTKAFGLALAS